MTDKVFLVSEDNGSRVNAALASGGRQRAIILRDDGTMVDQNGVSIGGGSSGPASALTAVQVDALGKGFPAIVRPASWWATQEFSNPEAQYTGTGSTFISRRSVPFNPVGARVISYNAGTAPTVGGCTYGVGVAASAAPATIAVNPVAVTWSGGKADPIAAGLFKGTASGGAGAGIVEMAISDPVTLTSVARADGGTGYIVELRTYVPSGVLTTYSLAPTPTSGTAVQLVAAGGTAFSSASKVGDFSTPANWSSLTAPTVSTSQHFIFGDLLLFWDGANWTAGAGGDSIARGQYSFDGRSNEFKLACDALTLAGIANVQYLGHSRPSQGVDTFGASDINFIRTMKPGIFFYTPYSPNDGQPAGSALIKAKNWLANIKMECDLVGTRLVICSSTPWAPFGSAGDVSYRAYNTQLQILAAAMGVPFHDRYTITNDPANPGSLLPGLGYVSGTPTIAAHPADAGYQFLQPSATSIIRALIGK